MIEEIKNIDITRSNLRKFGFLIVFIIFLLNLFIIFTQKNISSFFLITSISLIFISLIYPKSLHPLYWIWMSLASLLSWLMTRVILILLFYIILTPIGIMSRLFGKKFIQLTWKNDSQTFWNDRNTKHVNKQNYTKQF